MRVARITEAGQRAIASEKLHPTSTRILTLLSVATDAVPIGTIRKELDIARGPFPRLQSKGYIELENVAIEQSPWQRLEGAAGGRRLELTAHQNAALEKLKVAIVDGRFDVPWGCIIRRL